MRVILLLKDALFVDFALYLVTAGTDLSVWINRFFPQIAFVYAPKKSEYSKQLMLQYSKHKLKSICFLMLVLGLDILV